MKNGLICYDENRYGVNVFFYDRLVIWLKKYGVNAHLCFGKDIMNNLDGADFVVMRTYTKNLNKELEDRGIKVFNNSLVSDTCNDKYLTNEFIKDIVPILPYYLIKKGEDAVKYPVIVKSRFGHGGKQVFWVNDKNDLMQAFETCGEDNLLAQEIASDLGKDLRVYILGGKIFKSVLRSNDNGFKANFTLGGKVSEYKLKFKERITIKKIIKAFKGKLDLVGIDFLFDKRNIIFNEIEDIVGTRMLYKFDIDAAKIYAEYIAEILNDEK